MKSPGIMTVSRIGGPAQIDGLPDRDVLTHPDAPEAVAAALVEYREACEEAREAGRVHRAAEKEVRENTVRVRGETERWHAEVAAKVEDEARAVRLAENRSTATARKVVAEISEHEDTLRSIEARLALQAYARRVDAAVEDHEAARDFGRFGGTSFQRPVRGEDPTVIGGGVLVDPLERLDRVDTHRLADLAGTRLDLVEVWRFRGQGSDKTDRVLTTSRRARMLVEGTGGEAWRYADNEEATA